jgi:hypothetical protein
MEGAGAWKAERERPNQSSTTARPAYRIISTEWLGLQSPNLMHKHAEVAIKNWALRWTDGGHHRNQDRRQNARNPSHALLAIGVARDGPRTGSQMEIDPVIKIQVKTL